MRAESLGLGERGDNRRDAHKGFARNFLNGNDLQIVETLRPPRKRAAPPVGRTWFGPAA